MSTQDPTCMDDFDPDALSIAEARQRILAALSPISRFECLPLKQLSDRILAEAVYSPIDIPGFTASAMDGYACIHDDLRSGTLLRSIGTSYAGHPCAATLSRGECARIMTGGMVPLQADTVVMQEHCVVVDDQIKVNRVPAIGANIRAHGSNVQRQALLLDRHTRIAGAEMGLLAAAGITKVNALERLRVAVISTGDELIEPGNPLLPGQIHDANRYMLMGLLADPSLEVIDLGICADSESDLRACFAQASSADVVISSGGVSVGEADHVRSLLAESGRVEFWKIAMKPGRPLTYALLTESTPYFGLPGNPVSGMVTFHQFVQPAIGALLGQTWAPPVQVSAELQEDLRKQAGRLELQRGILTQNDFGLWQVRSTGMQDSHVLTSMHRANCYILLDLASTGASAGEMVHVLPFMNYA